MHTDEPEPQRRRRLSSKDTPNVFQSAKPFSNSSSYQSSWTAVYLLILPTPALLSLPLFPLQPQTLLTPTLMGPWGICSLRQLQSSRLHLRHGSKSSPKTLHTSAHKFVPAHLSHRPLELCPPKRCLCWCPSLTSNPDPQHLNSGPVRWVWFWSSYCYHRSFLHLSLSFHFPSIYFFKDFLFLKLHLNKPQSALNGSYFLIPPTVQDVILCWRWCGEEGGASYY